MFSMYMMHRLATFLNLPHAFVAVVGLRTWKCCLKDKRQTLHLPKKLVAAHSNSITPEEPPRVRHVMP
jgi:hypothetical protein